MVLIQEDAGEDTRAAAGSADFISPIRKFLALSAGERVARGRRFYEVKAGRVRGHLPDITPTQI
jgi:hypothetical protein